MTENTTTIDSQMAQPAGDPFQVRLEVFEGPLDVLLRLIERKQLEISKVSLAEVSESFLEYIAAHPDMLPGPLASFVWVASKLLWIKSQSLLPRPPLPNAEEDEEDPGDELVRRLEAYKRVKEAARWLRAREAQGLRSYERTAASEVETSSAPAEPGLGLDGVTMARLARMVQRRMQMQMPVVAAVGTATRGHVITVADRVAYLRGRIANLKEGERAPLGESFVEAAGRSRTEFAVLFLAVLEVIRRGFGYATQDELFGEIWLMRMVPPTEQLPEGDFARPRKLRRKSQNSSDTDDAPTVHGDGEGYDRVEK